MCDRKLGGPLVSSFVPRYEPLERLPVPRPVDRLRFIGERCYKRRVLDLGALDETAYKTKQGTEYWLHNIISRNANSVIGIDSSPLVPIEGLQTFKNARIVRGDAHNPAACAELIDFRPEVVVAGELIEHLENPLLFLKALREVSSLRGAELLITTPNATALHNCAIACLSMESTHRDHMLILSYKTLTTLLTRAGFTRWQIVPYRSQFTEMKLRSATMTRALVRSGEWVVNRLEALFPLLAFGWIVVTKLD